MVYHYQHPEWFEGMEKPMLSQQDTIILWGAGKVGSVVAHSLEKRGLKVEAFVDIAKVKQGTTFCGYPVISPEMLYAKYEDVVIIVSCGFPVVYQNLKKSGLKRVYDPHAFLMEVDFDGYAGGLSYEFATRMVDSALRNYAMSFGKGFLIERLIFVITDKCTLNCRNCDGYIPYHTHPRTDDFSSIVDSYEKIMKVCGYVDTVDIMGGETLLHPELPQLTDYFVNDSRCGNITIISNGTIVPNEKLTRTIKSPKVLFRLSDYGPLSRKKETILALFNREKIRYELTDYPYWDEVPFIKRPDETDEQLSTKYSACTANVLYIKHGKLFQCRFVTGLSDLGENLLPDFEKNYVDLRSSNKDLVSGNIRTYIEQLRSRTPLDACKYCPGGHCILFGKHVPVAEQANGKLPLELLFKDGVRLCD